LRALVCIRFSSIGIGIAKYVTRRRKWSIDDRSEEDGDEVREVVAV
jgi:hypothetical protein